MAESPSSPHPLGVEGLLRTGHAPALPTFQTLPILHQHGRGSCWTLPARSQLVRWYRPRLAL